MVAGYTFFNYDICEPDRPQKRCFDTFEEWTDEVGKDTRGKKLREYRRFRSSLRAFNPLGVRPVNPIEHRFIIITLADDTYAAETYLSIERDKPGIFACLSKDYDKIKKKRNNKDRHGQIYPIDEYPNILIEPYVTFETFIKDFANKKDFVNPTYDLGNRNCHHLVRDIVVTLQPYLITSLYPSTLPSKSIIVSKDYYEDKFAKKLLPNLSNIKHLVGPSGSGKTEMALYIVQKKSTEGKALYVDVNLSRKIDIANKNFTTDVENLVSNRILDKLYLPVESVLTSQPYKDLKIKLVAITSPLFIALDGIDDIVEHYALDFRKMIKEMSTNKHVQFLTVSSVTLYQDSDYKCEGFSLKLCKTRINQFIKKKARKECITMITKSNVTKCNPEVFEYFVSDYNDMLNENINKDDFCRTYNNISVVTPEVVMKSKYESLQEDEKYFLQVIAILCLSWNHFAEDDIKNYAAVVSAEGKANNKMQTILEKYQSTDENSDTVIMLDEMLSKVLSKFVDMSIIRWNEERKTYVIKSSICQYLLEFQDEQRLRELRFDYAYYCFHEIYRSPPAGKRRIYIKRKWQAELVILMAIGKAKIDSLNLDDDELQKIMKDIGDIRNLLGYLNNLLSYPNDHLMDEFRRRVQNTSLTEVDNATTTDIEQSSLQHSGLEDLRELQISTGNNQVGTRIDTSNEQRSRRQRFFKLHMLIWDVIHPRLLYILHNDGNEPSYSGLPRNPLYLYMALRREENRKQIEILRKRKIIHTWEYFSIFPECRKCKCSRHVFLHNRTFSGCKECLSEANKCKCEFRIDSAKLDILLICKLIRIVLKESLSEVKTYVAKVPELRNVWAHFTPNVFEDESHWQWQERWKQYKDIAIGLGCKYFNEESLFLPPSNIPIVAFQERVCRPGLPQLSHEIQENVAVEENGVDLPDIREDIERSRTSRHCKSIRNFKPKWKSNQEQENVIISNVEPKVLFIRNKNFRLGRGKSMATKVYIGYQLGTGFVAVKQIQIDDSVNCSENEDKFKLKEYECKHLLRYQVYKDDHYNYLVNELCECTLEQYINENPKLEDDIRWKLIDQLLDGIEYLHEKSIIATNLNPATILITLDGTLRISDFEEISEGYKNICFLKNFRWIHIEMINNRDVSITQQDNIFTILMLVFYIFYGRHPFDNDDNRYLVNLQEYKLITPRKDREYLLTRFRDEFQQLFYSWKEISVSDIKLVTERECLKSWV